MRIAHLINPAKVAASSDLRVAQPITFETMRRARDVVRLEQAIGPLRRHPAAWGMSLESSWRWLLRELLLRGFRRNHERVRRLLTRI